jgi:hypothetical protein
MSIITKKIKRTEYINSKMKELFTVDEMVPITIQPSYEYITVSLYSLTGLRNPLPLLISILGKIKESELFEDDIQPGVDNGYYDDIDDIYLEFKIAKIKL